MRKAQIPAKTATDAIGGDGVGVLSGGRPPWAIGLTAGVEDELIELSDLSDDEKSALWLYAWSFVDWRAQRREARAHIARLTSAAGAATTAA